MKKALVSFLLVLSLICFSVPATMEGTDYSTQEPYTIVIWADAYCSEEACEEVAAAMTDILKPLYNTSVEIKRFDFSVYVDSVTNALVSGEKIDLLGGVSDLGIPNCARQGMVLPLDDLLENYGKDILADVPAQDLASTSYNGKIYAIRNNKELGCGLGFACDAAILNSLGIDYSNIHSEEEMKPIFEAVKEKYPDVYPWVSDSGAMDYLMYATDYLGRDFGVLMDCFKDTTDVVNFYTSPEYYETCKRRYEWQKEGLIMQDAGTNPEQATSLIASGKGFAVTTETKPGIKSQFERLCGKEMEIIQIVDDYSMTSNLNNYWYIPYTSEKPERAMQALNEIYKNPDLENLLIYGVEGKYYEVVDAEKGLINYPEGQNSDSLKWTIAAWHMPNELIAYKWETDGPDIWDETIKFNAEAHQSPAKGFIWDSSSVVDEIVACTTVREKYNRGLVSGDVDPDTVWQQMLDEFESAGVQKILDEKQRQLNYWLENYK